MEKLNEFFDDNKDSLVKFYDSLMISTKPLERIVIPSQVKQNSLAALHYLIGTTIEANRLDQVHKVLYKKCPYLFSFIIQLVSSN